MSATMLDRSKVEAAFVAFSTVFDMKLKNTPTIYEKIATVIPGVSERIEFKWLGSIPTLKRWVGDRTFQKLRGETRRSPPSGGRTASRSTSTTSTTRRGSG
jgi:phage major head subunit gpT-like protein